MTDEQTHRYQQIADELRAAIDAGRYPPGARLPGAQALASSHGVAPLTARQALRVLRNEGLIETRKGAAARVIDFRPIRRRGIQRLSREQWEFGKSIWAADDQRPLTVDVSVDVGTPPTHISELLELGEGEAACIRSRRYVLDERPVAFAISYLPHHLVEGTAITRVDTGAGGTYARLSEIGHAPAYFREEVRSRLPLAEEAERLDMPTERSVLRVFRTAFEETGAVVEITDMTLDSAAYVLDYSFSA